MDISRRKVFGLMAGAAGGLSLGACASGRSVSEYSREKSPVGVSFDHGVASGDATHDSFILWTRVTPERDTNEPIWVTIFYGTDRATIESLEDGTMGEGVDFIPVNTGINRDYTVKADFQNLPSDTVYHYRFAVETDAGMVFSPVGKTRTLPASGGEQANLAVISCSNWPFGYFNVYKAIAQRDDVDAVIHLGDYIYEYGVDGYGGQIGEQIGRRHDPVTEIVTLEDYRTRHAQYKSDPDLQAAHAIAPWYCTWDDHESTNNSYRSGAENHNPENNEGDWTARKQVAVQAYMEWMPVRELQPGRAAESIYRSADWGDLASIFMLESRLTGRSDEISWFSEVRGDMAPEEIMATVQDVNNRVNDPSRTMLGGIQEGWLADGMKSSVEGGKTWQLLANQVIMANVKLPNLTETLTPEEIGMLPAGYVNMLVPFSTLGQSFNLDAWDGFPAARQRLYDAAKDAGANMLVITGDTHTAWANDLNDSGGLVGVEFGCTSVTSPGMGTSAPIDRLGQLMADANDDVVWYDPFGHGYTMLKLTPEKATADYHKVSTVLEREFTTEKVATYETTLGPNGVTPLRPVV
ncbi:alkaline phosphatase D family protein [Ponticaulis koreensis]|uniref:alkaline phosphatase D family protein n=1 Tax=Ponticaulis koreensis TaxID=1123045 RepID=UPI0003B71FAF|nr:alkaline phosphatase D family protein [Ponticaulis koreensis]